MTDDTVSRADRRREDEMGDFSRELAVAIEAARRAGQAILDAYGRDATTAVAKSDGSPVTEADLAADRLIRETIGASFPDDALLTEEGADDPARLEQRRCWIVDPLDGTAQFVARTDDFDVFVALTIDGRPVAAAACHPVSGDIWSAAAGAGAWVQERGGQRRRVHVSPQSAKAPPRLVASKWYGGREHASALEQIAVELGVDLPPVLETGFTPRKLLSEPPPYDGFLGLTPRWDKTPAREWDIVVPDLIVNEAGGRLTDLWGRPHRYNKRSPRVDGGLLISATVVLHERLLAAVRNAVALPDGGDRG